MAQYKILQKLQGLPWATFNPEEIIFLLWGIEIEFINLINEAKRNYHFAKEKAQSELYTEEFHFEGYKFGGDRGDFLNYHIFEEKRIDSTTIGTKLGKILGYYKKYIKSLSEDQHISPFFRQRQDWVGILRRIEDQHDWNQLGFSFMKFYFEKSVSLDADSKKLKNEVLPKEAKIDEVFLHHYYGQQFILFDFLKT